MTTLEIKNLTKSFGDNLVLDTFNFSVSGESFVGLLGASGSGKSTLLRHMAGLVEADGNTESVITIDGHVIQSAGKFAPDIRKSRAGLGFIFQQFNLVPRLSVLNNVLIGALYDTPKWRTMTGMFTKAQKLQAIDALREVGMHKKAYQRVSTLSGGQQQRVAIARVLMRDVSIIFADEPVASLDPNTSRMVLDLLQKIAKERNIPVIVALHQLDYALEYSDEIVALKKGRIFFRGGKEDLTPELSEELYKIDPDADHDVVEGLIQG